jgi:hypothetical protein
MHIAVTLDFLVRIIPSEDDGLDEPSLKAIDFAESIFRTRHYRAAKA